MNTADDLLRRALEVLEAAGALGFGHPPIGKEIRAYLDAPKDEPVAYIYEGNGIKTLNFVTDDMKSHLNGDGVSLLFLHPFVQKGVPVAWICEADIDNPISAMVRTQHPCGPCNLPLYLHPPTKTAPKKPMTEEEDEVFNSASKYAAWLETENRILREAKKPMTEEEIEKGIIETGLTSRRLTFYAGIRLAERHHGITGEGE